MFAINHAATALVIKKHYPKVPLIWLLLSVQLVEILWVLLNFLGIELTTTNADVSTVRDINLVYMPYSHSLVSSIALAFLAWFLTKKKFKHRAAAIAIAIAVFSHIILDVVTHTRDITVIPFFLENKIGMGLYTIPLAAFMFETVYGVMCWWLFRGSNALLAVILLFNMANISFFSETITGPESLMANKPLWIVSAVAVQIVATLVMVGWFARPRARRLEQQAGTQPSSTVRSSVLSD